MDLKSGSRLNILSRKFRDPDLFISSSRSRPEISGLIFFIPIPSRPPFSGSRSRNPDFRDPDADPWSRVGWHEKNASLYTMLLYFELNLVHQRAPHRCAPRFLKIFVHRTAPAPEKMIFWRTSTAPAPAKSDFLCTSTAPAPGFFSQIWNPAV